MIVHRQSRVAAVNQFQDAAQPSLVFFVQSVCETLR